MEHDFTFIVTSNTFTNDLHLSWLPTKFKIQFKLYMFHQLDHKWNKTLDLQMNKISSYNAMKKYR